MRVIIKKLFAIVRPGGDLVLPEGDELVVTQEGSGFHRIWSSHGALDLTADQFNRHVAAGDIEITEPPDPR